MNDLDLVLSGLARSLADLIERTCGDRVPAGSTLEFLRSWAEERALLAGLSPDTGDSPLARVRDALGLSGLEVEFLVLAGMADEHEGVASTLRDIHPRGEPRPTVGLATHLLSWPEGPDVVALVYSGQLVHTGVVRVVGDWPLQERSIQLSEGLWPTLRGLAPDGVLADHVDLGPAPAGLEHWLQQPAARDALLALQQPERRAVLVLAEDRPAGLARCAALAGAVHRTTLARFCPSDDQVALARLSVEAVARDALPVAVVIDPPDGSAHSLDVSRVAGPVLVCAAPGLLRLDRPEPVLTVPVGLVSAQDRRRAWAAAAPGLGATLSEAAPDLAARHLVDPVVTAQVGADLQSRSLLRYQDGDLRAQVTRAIRDRASAHLPAGVSLTSPTVGWERLVVPQETHEQLREAVGRLRHQSLVLEDWGLAESARAAHGIRLLFTGPPGTGKTLAAEVVATAASTDLLTVDVSNVVSKWIGETEKNLGAVFDVAERTQAVLFLDEADALFGARTEISDAHDRYANLETAFLLQRLDRFEGLAVLATNLRSNIDPAFLRRMDALVEFELPDVGGRRRLWELHLPKSLRHDDVDLAALAERYAVPGGWVRNAAIAAAFLAAGEAGRVHQAHLVRALAREYAKDSRSIPEPGPARRRSAGRTTPPDRRAVRALAAAALTMKESS
jgi:hypothetical protein